MASSYVMAPCATARPSAPARQVSARASSAAASRAAPLGFSSSLHERVPFKNPTPKRAGLRSPVVAQSSESPRVGAAFAAEPSLAVNDKSFGIPVAAPTILPEDLAHAMQRPPACGLLPKKTHVVCTLGPATRTPEEIAAILNVGMSVARFNFSHGSHEYHSETLEFLDRARRLSGKRCGVLLDTKGPEIRTGMLHESTGGKVTIQGGSDVILTTDYAHLGTAECLAVSYASLPRDVEEGMRILVADGALVLEVLDTDVAGGRVRCRAVNTASLGERKNCNLPGVKVDLPILTEKDKEDLRWGVRNNVDFVAASFVRKGDDVRYIRNFLDEEGGSGIQIISKVENQEGLENFDDILSLSNGIMVARGDLGMEIPLEKMFYVQKMMIHKCNLAGKPVVTATQMLDSMIANPRPTRAEATDVANAVLDGTDCVMLSGETAAGAFPKESVEIMSSICEEAERCIDNYTINQNMMQTMMKTGDLAVIESLAANAVVTAEQIGAKVIVVLAASGIAARLIAKYRPSVPVVVGVVPRERRQNIGFEARDVSSERVANQLMLTRGLIPTIVSKIDRDEGEPAAAAKRAVDEAIVEAKKQGLCQNGDKVVSMYNVAHQCAVIRVVEVM